MLGSRILSRFITSSLIFNEVEAMKHIILLEVSYICVISISGTILDAWYFFLFFMG